MPTVNSKDPAYSVHEEPVPVKFFFYRRQHAMEFLAELRQAGVSNALFGQTFSGGRERWMVTADWQVLEYGAALYRWLSEAKERWAPSEGKLGAEAKT